MDTCAHDLAHVPLAPLPIPRPLYPWPVDNLCPEFDPAAALSFPAIAILRALRERVAPVGSILNIQSPDAFLAFIYSMRTSGCSAHVCV